MLLVPKQTRKEHMLLLRSCCLGSGDKCENGNWLRQHEVERGKEDLWKKRTQAIMGCHGGRGLSDQDSLKRKSLIQTRGSFMALPNQPIIWILQEPVPILCAGDQLAAACMKVVPNSRWKATSKALLPFSFMNIVLATSMIVNTCFCLMLSERV